MPSSHVFVLRRQPYQENALLVDLFTQSEGRLTVIATHSQRQANRQRAMLEPFRLLECGWRGQGEVFSLTQLEEKRRFRVPRMALLQATYASELVLRTTEVLQAQPELFRRYQHLLHHLQEGKNTPLLLWFELAVLECCGYPLEQMAQQSVDSDTHEYYYLSMDTGLQAQPTDTVVQSDQVALSGGLLRGLSQPECMNVCHWQELRRVIDRLLQILLEGKPLYARALSGVI